MLDRLMRALRRVPQPVAAGLAIVAFAGVAAWLTVSTWNGLSSSRLDVGRLTDFRDAIYYPVVALRDGVNPYNVDAYYRHYPVGQEFPLYSPIHLLLNAPLLLFSFSTARAVAFGWNLLLTIGLAAAALRLAGHRLRTAPVFAVATLIMLSEPGKFDLRSGQPTLMLVIGIVIALRTAGAVTGPTAPTRVPSPAVSALLGAVAIAIVWSKPTYAIPLVVVLLVTGRRRVAITGTAIGLVLSAVVIPFLVDAAGGIDQLVTSWRDSARITARSPQSALGTTLRIDIGNTFVRVTHLHPSENVAAIGGLILLAVGAAVLWKLHRADPAGDREELMITTACLLMLTSAYHVTYDHLLLIGPIVMLARPRATTAIAWPRRVRTVVLVLMLIPVVDPLGWSVVNAVVGKSGFEWMLGPTVLSLELLAALALCLWTGMRQVGASAQVRHVVEAGQAPTPVQGTDA